MKQYKSLYNQSNKHSFKESKQNINDKVNLFLYLDIWDERDNFQVNLYNIENDVLWDWSYSEPSEDDEEGGYDSSPVDDGYMKNWKDIKGLEKYLKDLGIISKKASIYNNEDDAIEASEEGLNEQRSRHFRFNEAIKWNNKVQKLSWSDVEDYINDLGGGWRLPTLEELYKEFKTNPKRFKKGDYWSSEEGDEGMAFYMDGSTGNTDKDYKFNDLYVCLVK